MGLETLMYKKDILKWQWRTPLTMFSYLRYWLAYFIMPKYYKEYLSRMNESMWGQIHIENVEFEVEI